MAGAFLAGAAEAEAFGATEATGAAEEADGATEATGAAEALGAATGAAEAATGAEALGAATGALAEAEGAAEALGAELAGVLAEGLGVQDTHRTTRAAKSLRMIRDLLSVPVAETTSVPISVDLPKVVDDLGESRAELGYEPFCLNSNRSALGSCDYPLHEVDNLFSPRNHVTRFEIHSG